MMDELSFTLKLEPELLGLVPVSCRQRIWNQTLSQSRNSPLLPTYSSSWGLSAPVVGLGTQ